MQRTSFPSGDENMIEASVTIQRPVEDVFKFYRDFKNLPRFLGDVMATEHIGPATSRWTVQGPGHSNALDDASDCGAHKCLALLRDGHFTSAEDLLGNPICPWISGS